MIKRSFEFFLLYNKEVFYNKIAYLWTLLIPLGLMIINNRSWIASPPSIEEYQTTLFFYWSFMILITATSGVGIALLIVRDNGFLKMFKFISGSKMAVILGKMESQWFFIFVNLLFFNLVTSLLFHQPVFHTLSIAFLVALIVPLPVFFLFLWIASLPLKSETIAPVFTLLIFPMIYAAGYIQEISNPIISFFAWLNPASLIVNTSSVIAGLVSNLQINTLPLLSSLTGILFCIIIGNISYKMIGITSKSAR
ncbi:hypothetical protein JI667_18965 [Bacillus sp. NTK074B]|uniref:hypothetical protein n=1 Tax=Bacillus sp. NTK074B TaxID=2802174 RepID=UPI001A8C3360|nr:hypothetical protein [Bacillus sp. NTK074B]